MAKSKSSRPTPEGWNLVKKAAVKGSKTSYYYLCPATGQQFFNYGDLMEYVKYAKDAKVSIYSPTFTTEKQKRQAGLGAKKRKLTGESSNSSAINQNNADTLQENAKLGAENIPANRVDTAEVAPNQPIKTAPFDALAFSEAIQAKKLANKKKASKTPKKRAKRV